jgi:hypothetical protein
MLCGPTTRAILQAGRFSGLTSCRSVAMDEGEICWFSDRAGIQRERPDPQAARYLNYRPDPFGLILFHSCIFKHMSFAQILDEIPKLSFPERRELFLQVLSLEPEADDLAVCDHVAMEGFAMLEEMEAPDTAHLEA